MALDFALLVPASVTGREPVAFTFEPGDIMVAMGSDNPTLEEQLAALSFRALLGLSAACAEWTYRRFEGINPDPELAQLIEAIWVAAWDYRHLRRDQLSFAEDPNDPAKNALQVTKDHLASMCRVYEIVEYGIVSYVRSSASLVRFMTQQPKPFQAWFKLVVKRLQDLSEPSAAETCSLGYVDDDPRGGLINSAVWGTPVVRSWFATEWSGTPSDFKADMTAFLERLRPQDNRFLYSVAELKARGVEHPYTVA